MIKRRDQKGFTIVELLLAMSFFSFVLLFFSFGFIQVTRTFQKGATIKRITETGRSVVEDIARNTRISGAAGTEVLGNRLCFSNGIHYGWNEAANPTSDTLLPSDEPYTLVRSQRAAGTACADRFTLTDSTQEISDAEGNLVQTEGISSLVEDGIVVQALTVQKIPQVDALRIDITLSSEDLEGDQLDLSAGAQEAKCNGFVGTGNSFCDVVRFTTTVNFRLP